MSKSDKETIVLAYDAIENMVKEGRRQMSGDTRGCKPGMVCAILGCIGALADLTKDLQWPDPEGDKLKAAKANRTLQKTLTKASRKTIIRG